MQRIKKITRRLLEFLFINPLFSNPLIVGGSSALFIVYSHYYLLPPIIREIPLTDMEHIKNFIEWFGVPYGLFIALVLVNLWNQHDTVDREFDAEADAVSALQHTALMVRKNPSSSSPRKIILLKIDEYVNHVKQYYRLEYTKRNAQIRNEGNVYIEEIREAVGNLVHTNEEDAIKTELLELTNQLRDIRGDRLTHSRQRMHTTVWALSMISSVLWLLPFYGLAISKDYVAIVLQGGVTFVVIAILAVIKDLNNPFTGTWRVDLSAWDELENRLAERKEKTHTK